MNRGTRVPIAVLIAGLACAACAARAERGAAASAVPSGFELGGAGTALPPERAGGFDRSQLVLGQRSPASGGTLFAQRVIDREWGQSDDSVYVEKDVPGWRSEVGAMAMSAALPGVGQYYADGASGRGVFFALAEAAAWTAHVVLHRSGERVRDDASRFAGAPGDSNSTWSVARWQQATAASSGDIQALYAADREAFYDVIATDPRFEAGWSSEANRTKFSELRATSDRRLYGARFSESMVWVNHLVAAVDALRAARQHNMRLGPALGFNVKSGWSHGHPEWRASFNRRF